MQKKFLIMIIVVICFYSGLASSQSHIDAESVLKYFASFYIPSEHQATTRAMLFGQEFRPDPVTTGQLNTLPDRNYLK